MRDLVATIPKEVTGKEELVVLPRRILERLFRRSVKVEDVLKWSRQAKHLKRAGKLPLLRSLKELG